MSLRNRLPTAAQKTRVRSSHPISLFQIPIISIQKKSHYVLSTDGEQPSQQSALGSSRSPNSRNPRATRRINAQATKLEAVGDEIDPLGPLGDKTGESSSPLSSNEQAPEPPQKDSFAARNVRPTSSTSQASSLAGMMDSVNLEENGAGFRVPPPVQPPGETEGANKQSQPSMSIEEAAKPTFEIVVGDPHKVGDLTSSHIVYQVRTKVGREEWTSGVKSQLRGLTTYCRHRPKHTDNRSSLSAVVTAISSGSTIRCITITLVSWWPLPRRSRPLADSIPTLLSRGELRWSVCSIRSPDILSYNTTETLRYSWRARPLVSMSRIRRIGNRTWARTRACSAHSGSTSVAVLSL